MCLVIDRHLPPWIHILRWIFPRSAFWRIAFASVMLLTGALIPAMYWFTVIVVAVVAVGIGDLVGYQPPNALNRLELLFDLPTPSCIVAELECLLRHESEDTLDRLHRSVYAWRPWAIIYVGENNPREIKVLVSRQNLDVRHARFRSEIGYATTTQIMGNSTQPSDIPDTLRIERRAVCRARNYHRTGTC